MVLSFEPTFMAIIGFGIICFLTYLFIMWAQNTHSQLGNRPPGPRPLPLIGNLMDMPREKEWEIFSQWAKVYGGIVFVNIVGRPLIILNTVEAATHLLVERSSIYSDRPYFPLIDLVGHPKFNFGFMPYGKAWQARRKLFASKYGKSNIGAYYDTYRACTLRLLRNLHRNPHKHADYLRLHAGQLILDATYGLKIESNDDPLIKTAEAVMKTVSFAVSPVMWVFNPVPFLQKLPAWLVGWNVSRHILRWQHEVQYIQTVPFEMTRAEMASGNNNSSFTSSLLEAMDSWATSVDSNELLIRDCAAVAYGGGSDTTVSSATTFLLAMLLYPRVQECAQQEIDNVTKGDRLPDFLDYQNLPYINAIMKEVLRWHPPAPQGIPHLLTQDDFYKGFHLPAGTMVIGNIWGILHDPTIFKDPLEFRPERHLGLNSSQERSQLDDLTRVAFGFGRRICPGRLFAENTLWLLIAQVLAVFSITPSGNTLPEKPKFTSGAISHPVPFSCNIRPRLKNARILLQQADNVEQKVKPEA